MISQKMYGFYWATLYMSVFRHLYVIVCCTACTVANCDECSSSLSQCTTCSAGYYRSSATACI